MGILEFIWRILENVLWILGGGNPLEIANAILNIIHLFFDNLRLFG